MKFAFRIGCLIALIAAASSNLSANSFTVTLQNGGSNVMGGVYVGPYNFTAKIGKSTAPMALVCDDFKDEVFPGEKWKVVTSTFPSLSHVKWGGQKVKYEEVAWLIEQMFKPANHSSAHTVGVIQWAIWDIFTPGVSGSLSKSENKDVTNWLALAGSNYGSGNYSNLVIYTAIPGTQVPSHYGPPQEYFGWNPPTQTPEPGSLLLLGTGIAGVLGWRRRLNGRTSS